MSNVVRLRPHRGGWHVHWHLHRTLNCFFIRVGAFKVEAKGVVQQHEMRHLQHEKWRLDGVLHAIFAGCVVRLRPVG